MTTTEMIYVLDKQKECIQRRELGQCDMKCNEHCSSYIETSSVLDAIERIITFIFNMDRQHTRKSY